jgi:hypothetical protein
LDDDLVFFEAGGIAAPAMDNPGSRRLMNSGAFFEVNFKAWIAALASG